MLVCGFAGMTAFPRTGLAGSARDYLNAPIDTWLKFYNVSYPTSVTPEEGTDVTSSIRSNAAEEKFIKSFERTRTQRVNGTSKGDLRKKTARRLERPPPRSDPGMSAPSR